MCRELLGATLADQLGVPRASWTLMLPYVRRLISGADRIRESVPYAERRALRAGTAYWERVVTQGLAGATMDFALPAVLRARAAS